MFGWLKNADSKDAEAVAAAIGKSQAVIEFRMDGTIVTANENPPMLVSGALDGDHESDLVVVYRSPSGKTTPWFATGAGGFRRGATYHAGAFPSAAAIGKLTTSGYGDIAVSKIGRAHV